MSSESWYFRVCAIDQHRAVGAELGGVEQAPDAASEVAFEAANGFALGLPLGVFAIKVGAGFGVGSGSGERDDVDRAVELAIAAAV